MGTRSTAATSLACPPSTEAANVVSASAFFIDHRPSYDHNRRPRDRINHVCHGLVDLGEPGPFAMHHIHPVSLRIGKSFQCGVVPIWFRVELAFKALEIRRLPHHELGRLCAGQGDHCVKKAGTA